MEGTADADALLLAKCCSYRTMQQEVRHVKEGRRAKVVVPDTAPIYSVRLDSREQQPEISSLNAALRSTKKSVQVSFPQSS